MRIDHQRTDAVPSPGRRPEACDQSATGDANRRGGSAGAPAGEAPGRHFYERDAITVARELVGCRLFRVLPDGSWAGGTIVETEAYREDDPASHSFRGPSPRARVMFGPSGTVYVYLIYGVHECCNIVCEPEGAGAAVLIRAIEPTSGLAWMRDNRYREAREACGVKGVHGLASGPGKLCAALRISRAEHNGRPIQPPAAAGPGDIVVLARTSEWIERYGDGAVGCGPRVGIRKAADRPWRFRVEGSPFVSR